MYDPRNLEETATHLRRLIDEKERVEEKLKTINKQIAHVQEAVLPQLMESHGVTNFRVDGIGTVRISQEVYASCPAANREELHGWLRDAGYEDMITESVHPSSFRAFAKERITSGEELPEFVKVSIKPTARMRRLDSGE